MKKYYVSANTAEGFKYKLAENIKTINTVITLRHSILINTAIIKGIIKKNEGKTSLEILKSPLSDSQLEGVILRDENIAIVSEKFQYASIFEKAYEEFSKGLMIHDKLEAIYIQEMDFKKADREANNLIRDLLNDVPKQNKKPIIYHRFFGTNTIDGVVNEVPHIIANLNHTYHIKGRAGTGKSTFMRKVAQAVQQHGLEMEWYHCSFDPSSIDMVIIPELNICLFDSTDPHAFEIEDAKRESIIDLYEIAVTPGTDEKYHENISKWTAAYKKHMKQGLQYLKIAAENLLKKEKTIMFTDEEINKEIRKIQMLIAGSR